MKRLSIIFILLVVASLNASELKEQRRNKLGEQISYLFMIPDHYTEVDAEKYTHQAMEEMWKNVSQCFKDAKNANDILLCNELGKMRDIGLVLQQAQKNNDHQSMKKILEQVKWLGILERDLRNKIRNKNGKYDLRRPPYLIKKIYKNVKKCREPKECIDDKLVCKQLKEMREWADIICGVNRKWL